MVVCEVASTTAGYQNLFSRFPGMVQYADMLSPLPCLYSTHQAGGTSTDNNDIVFFHAWIIQQMLRGLTGLDANSFMSTILNISNYPRISRCI